MKQFLAVLLFLLIPVQALAGGASSSWNDPWAFPSPQEKANILSHAMAMEFTENGGFTANNTNNYFQEQNCNADGSCFNGDAVAIGTNITIDGDGNLVTGTNDGNVGAQNNNGEGEINQGGNYEDE